jgi:hypothetical protein
MYRLMSGCFIFIKSLQQRSLLLRGTERFEIWQDVECFKVLEMAVLCRILHHKYSKKYFIQVVSVHWHFHCFEVKGECSAGVTQYIQCTTLQIEIVHQSYVESIPLSV